MLSYKYNKSEAYRHIKEIIYLLYFLSNRKYSNSYDEFKHLNRNLEYHASWVKNSKNAEQCLKILFNVLMAQRKAIYGYDVGSWLVM